MFPNRCECSAPGQCSHTGKLMSEGLYAECKSNHRFRLHLAGIDPAEWPMEKQRTSRVAKGRSVAGAVPSGVCIHLGDELRPRQDPAGASCLCSGKTARRCDLHVVCTLAVKYDGAACCGLNTAAQCRDYDTGADDLDPAALARDIAAGLGKWPEATLRSKTTRRVLQDMADRAVSNCPPVPGNLTGRGIVTCGGGRYDPSLFVMVRMVRHFGCALPVEIWTGPGEVVSPSVRALPGVVVKNAAAIPDLRVRGGWASKTAAMRETRFAEFMFIDADAYPVYNLETCFDHNPTGVVVFPDRTFTDGWIQKPSYGPGIDWKKAPPPISGGHYVFDTARAWPVLNLAYHYDQHSDLWYEYTHGLGGYGDQDQMRAAIAKMAAPWHMYAEQCEYERGVFWYYGPDGRVLFIHRAARKFARLGVFSAPPARNRRLPGEDLAWRYFEEWKQKNPLHQKVLRRTC